MFTGLIEAVCTVKSIHQKSGSAAVLTVDLGALGQDCKIGDSIAINGVCLTIAGINPAINPSRARSRDGESKHVAVFELSAETLAKTTLGKIKTGSLVNVERAMKATDRFGGHFVQGHIDGVATINTIKRASQFADIEFVAEPELLDQMVVKGSVAVDGISLTIANMNDNSFGVALIPETLKRTTLGTAKAGDVVNIETDIIVKIIKKQLAKIMPQQKKVLTMERLRELGF
jgi:riboflavin synthase